MWYLYIDRWPNQRQMSPEKAAEPGKKRNQ